MENTELLARIDERTSNIYKLVEEQGRHLDLINIQLDSHNSSIGLLNLTVYGKDANNGLVGQVGRNTSNIWKMVVFVSVLSAGIGGGVTKILELLK